MADLYEQGWETRPSPASSTGVATVPGANVPGSGGYRTPSPTTSMPRVARDCRKPTEEVSDGSHPPLIDPERFDRLLVLRASRDRGGDKRPKRGAPARNHAPAGIARCGKCGAPMRPITRPHRRKDGSRRRTYLRENVKGVHRTVRRAVGRRRASRLGGDQPARRLPRRLRSLARRLRPDRKVGSRASAAKSKEPRGRRRIRTRSRRRSRPTTSGG
jgi:hypothetical protein